LVIDFLNRDFVINNLIPEEKQTAGDYTVDIRRSIKNNMVKKDMVFTHQSTGERQVFSEQVKLYGLEWFCGSLDEYGLKLNETAGNYDGNPFDPQKSPRLILRAEKPA
jgi:hypothetical protein